MINDGKWSNAAFDTLIEECTTGSLAMNPEKRWESLKKAESIAMHDAMMFPLYEGASAVMIQPYVKNVEMHSVGIARVFKDVVIE